jgi:hypothetical protein
MITAIKITTISALCFTLCLSSCIQFQSFPPEPHIEFVSFDKISNSTGVDDQGTLVLSFTDGDGDVGLDEDQTYSPYDTTSMYYYNIFIKYFEKQSGQYIEVKLNPSNNGRLPNLTPEGEKKALQGNIAVDLYINNPLSSYDTIRFEVFIVDRALNHSDTITTPDIKVNK